MTARQSVGKNYESKLREYTNFAVRGIKKVCKDCGPRPSCSPEERKAQEMMQKELESCCDSVAMESFTASPGAFLLWVRTGVLTGIVSALAYNLGFSIVSLVLIVLELLFVVLQFLLYRQAADWFMPKKTSQNLIAVRKPSGEVKRRLILCGHSDSANEWTYTYLGHKHFNNTRLTVAVIAVSLVPLFLGLALSIIAVVNGRGWVGLAWLETPGAAANVLGYVFAGLCIPLLAGWFFESRRPVMGANDNLSGCFAAMGVAKMMGDLDLRLENTELMVLCSGCEEVGLRGIKDFCKKHAKQFQDVETAFIGVDTLRDWEHAGVFIRDMTMTVKHDAAVSAMLQTAAKTAGYDLPYQYLFFGASDTAAATQGGLRATLLAAMDPTPAPYYHTRLDTVDILEPKAIESGLDILMEAAYQFDETGLAPFEGSVVKA